MDKVLTGGVVVALVLSGLAFFSAPADVITERVIERVGAQAGPDHYDLQVFHAGHVDGGVVVSTSTTGNTTLLASQFVTGQGYTKYIAFNADEATTATLPATTTLRQFVPSSGDCAVVKVENTGDSNLTFAAGTGIDLQEIGDTNTTNVVIASTGLADLEFCRLSSRDIAVIVTESSPAD